MYTISVSTLNEQIKTLIESSFEHILVEGEISRITFHNSGHIYFTLKDEASSLRAVMFNANARKLKFQLKEGLKVVLNGAVTLYKPRGEYQINCFSIEPLGHGALSIAFEQLKEKLSSKGYFLETNKKQIPKFPKKLAFITSATGAALQDMLRVANSRFRALEIDIIDVLVQGKNAGEDISRAIKSCQNQDYCALIVARGGGSIEDLWAFNEEIVADAIFDSKIPIVSAVGHEIDWLISDFVSDLRAPTPSAAMEMILPDERELYQTIDSMKDNFDKIIEQKYFIKNQELKHLQEMMLKNSVENHLKQKIEEIKQIKNNLTQSMEFKLDSLQKDLQDIDVKFPFLINSILNIKQNNFENLKKNFELNNPKDKAKRGFVQLSKDDKAIDISSLNIDDTFFAQGDIVNLKAIVVNKFVRS